MVWQFELNKLKLHYGVNVFINMVLNCIYRSFKFVAIEKLSLTTVVVYDNMYLSKEF